MIIVGMICYLQQAVVNQHSIVNYKRQETTTTIGRTKNETWKTIVVDCFINILYIHTQKKGKNNENNKSRILVCI